MVAQVGVGIAVWIGRSRRRARTDLGPLRGLGKGWGGRGRWRTSSSLCCRTCRPKGAYHATDEASLVALICVPSPEAHAQHVSVQVRPLPLEHGLHRVLGQRRAARALRAGPDAAVPAAAPAACVHGHPGPGPRGQPDLPRAAHAGGAVPATEPDLQVSGVRCVLVVLCAAYASFCCQSHVVYATYIKQKKASDLHLFPDDIKHKKCT